MKHSCILFELQKEDEILQKKLQFKSMSKSVHKTL